MQGIDREGCACVTGSSTQQVRGFTCGYDDLLLVRDAEAARGALLARAEGAAVAASARYAGVELPAGYAEGEVEVRLGSFQCAEIWS